MTFNEFSTTSTVSDSNARLPDLSDREFAEVVRERAVESEELYINQLRDPNLHYVSSGKGRSAISFTI